jgi:hypothetical protein
MKDSITREGLPTIRFSGIDIVKVGDDYDILRPDDFDSLSDLEEIVKSKSIGGTVLANRQAWIKYEAMLFNDDEMRRFIVK